MHDLAQYTAVINHIHQPNSQAHRCSWADVTGCAKDNASIVAAIGAETAGLGTEWSGEVWQRGSL